MNLRERNIESLSLVVHDVLVVGGGINGAVSAAALAGKGARVALIDKGDFAGFTSQNSSNLIWGGIKYLESGDFSLVRKLCLSRNHLVSSYPSQVKEIRFFTTISKGFRFRPWFMWLGAWFYWAIGNGFTKGPRLLGIDAIKNEEPVIRTEDILGGFEYSDAYLCDNDSRFVFQFVRSAMDQGCNAANYVESLGAKREQGVWITDAHDAVSGATLQIRSRVLINASGPFVDEQNKLTGEQTKHHHVFSKGIHLVVPSITSSHRVLTFFADDGRLFFAIPMGERTCIGTTDKLVDSPYSEVTDEDREYVLVNINKRLKLSTPLTRADIISERCGVRPLAVTHEAQEVGSDCLSLSRKHEIDVDQVNFHLSIFRGKLTDCVNVGNEVSSMVDQTCITLPDGDRRWYGESHQSVREEYFRQALTMRLDSYTSLGAVEPLSIRLWRRYDRLAFELLARISENPREAEILIKGTDYVRCEIEITRRMEMVVKLEDFLRRRSNIALVMRRDDIRESEALMEVCRILFDGDAQIRFDGILF